ncbi:MAG: hypothetical protein FJX62_03385 [Alphaproteobacteria bacterium]|nr:hypothetical protein [Alphaproteobacteria bacterium]
MRRIVAAAVLAAIAVPGFAQAAPTKSPAKPKPFGSRVEAIAWMEGYRPKPEPLRMPEAIRAFSKAGALRDPEGAGFAVGFAAGVLGANPRDAERLIEHMLPLPDGDQWLAVRALAYSGLPAWQSIMARLTHRLPARRAMIDRYLTGELPTLGKIELDKSPTFLETVKAQFQKPDKRPRTGYADNPELLDTLWGVYFATGDYKPLWRIMTLLPWSAERDDTARLAAGSSAKLTLANNAARYPDILATLKAMAPYQEQAVAAALADVIAAAESGETGQVRKAQLAAMEELRRKGPGRQRDMKLWGHVGQGAIALGCIAAASVSLTALGLPCVIGGAVSSAAINYMASQ